MKFLTKPWPKEYDGILYFFQRLEEMLFHYSEDIVRVPIHNTRTLIKEYLDSCNGCREGKIKAYQCDKILEELRHSLKCDKILRTNFGDTFVQDIERKMSQDKIDVVQYLNNKLPQKTYFIWCVEYIKEHALHETHKDEIELGLKAWIVELISHGYSPEYIYTYLHSDKMGNNSASPVDVLNSFLGHFTLRKKTFRVYFAFNPILIEYKNLLEKRLHLDFSDDDFGQDIKKNRNDFVGFLDIEAIDPYLAISGAYHKLTVFIRYYQVISNGRRQLVRETGKVVIPDTQATLDDFNAAVDYLRLMDYRLRDSYKDTEEFKNIPVYDRGDKEDQGVVPKIEEINLWYSSLYVFIERCPDFLPATTRNFAYPYRKMNMSEEFPRFLACYILIKFLQAYKKDFIFIQHSFRKEIDDVTTKQLQAFVRNNTFIKALIVDYANVVSFPTYYRNGEHYFFENIGAWIREDKPLLDPFFARTDFACTGEPNVYYTFLRYLPVNGIVYRYANTSFSFSYNLFKRGLPERVAEKETLTAATTEVSKKITTIDTHIQSLESDLTALQKEHSNNRHQVEINNALIAKNKQKIFGKKKALSANEALLEDNAQLDQQNSIVQEKIKENTVSISTLQTERQKFANEIAEINKRIEIIKNSYVTDIQTVDVLRFYDPVT